MLQKKTNKSSTEFPSMANTIKTHKIKLSHDEYFEIVKKRAYELYIERGHGDGSAEQDWLDAEEDIQKKYTF